MQKPKYQHIASSIASQYNLQNPVFKGKGQFKETYHTANDYFGEIALKVIDPFNCDLCRTQREIDAMRECSSPVVGKLFLNDKLIHGGTDYHYFFEEYLDGGSLSNKIVGGPISPEETRDYAITLIHAISHLRMHNLVHRDIKPDNIMFRKKSDTPVLVDFGLVRNLSQHSLTLSCFPRGPCTPFFAAPEQLNNEKHLIGWRTDQFALGISLGFCLTGKHPFLCPGMTENQAIDAVSGRHRCADDFKQHVESLGCGFLVRMIETWPIRRYSNPEDIINDI